MTATEYGLFNDEGCVERGFWRDSDAAAASVMTYHDEDDLTVRALCADHDEQPADACEVCNSDDDDE